MTITITPAQTASLFTDFDQLDIAEAVRHAVAVTATSLDNRDRQALALLTYAPGLPAATRELLAALADGAAALPLSAPQAMHLHDAICDDILGPEPEWPVQEAWLAARESADTDGITPDAETQDDETATGRPCRPVDATTTAELQDSLNPFTFWRCSTPELAEVHRQVLLAAGKRPTPDNGNERVRIYAAIDKKGEPIAWVVGAEGGRVVPFDQARDLLTNNWADLIRDRPHFIPEW